MWAIAEMTARVETAQRRVFPPRRAGLQPEGMPPLYIRTFSRQVSNRQLPARTLVDVNQSWTLTSHGFVQIAASYRAHAVRSIDIAQVACGHSERHRT